MGRKRAAIDQTTRKVPEAVTHFDFAGPHIQIIAGINAEQKTFHVPEEPFVKYSVFFKQALQKEWKEGQTRTINLPEDCPACINTLIQFLCTSKIAVPPGVPTSRFKHLILCWILGDKYDITFFKDATLDAIDLLFASRPRPTITLEVLSMIYQRTLQGSRLRYLCVCLACRHWEPECWGKMAHDISEREFLADACYLLAAARPKGLFWRSLNCILHDHGPDEDCYKKAFSLG